MSSRAKVVVFYGICYEQDSGDAAKFRSSDDGASEGEDSPAWMAANLYREGRDGVEVVHFGHYDYPGFAVAILGTVDYGESWKPLEIRSLQSLLETRNSHLIGTPDDLKAFCERHGLTYRQPKWWAVPYYG